MVEAHSCPSVSKLKLRLHSLTKASFLSVIPLFKASNCSLVAPQNSMIFKFVWCFLVVNTREMLHRIFLYPKQNKSSIHLGIFFTLFILCFLSFPSFLNCMISLQFFFYPNQFACCVFLLYLYRVNKIFLTWLLNLKMKYMSCFNIHHPPLIIYYCNLMFLSHPFYPKKLVIIIYTSSSCFKFFPICSPLFLSSHSLIGGSDSFSL